EAVFGGGGVFGLTAVAPDHALAAGTQQPPVAGALPTRVPQFRHPGLTRTGSMPVRSKGAISEPVVGSPPQLVTVSGRARMESRTPASARMLSRIASNPLVSPALAAAARRRSTMT